MSNHISINKKQQSLSFLSWIAQYESLVVFGSFGCAIMVVIVLTGMFQAGPVIRTNMLYNTFGSLCMAFLFIYVVFKFMGQRITILGTEVDMGMVIYIAIILFVMFVLGN